MQERILIIEDNRTVARMLAAGIGNRFGIPVDVVDTYSESKDILEAESNYLLVLCDYILPDSNSGEIIDLVMAYKIPVIVMTTLSSNSIRRDIISKPIVDYVTKDHPEDLEYIIERVGEVHRNRNYSVLVVDDSSLARSVMRKLLRVQKFNVFEASDGLEALSIINDNPNINIVLTDYNMPNMNGLELTIKLRQKYPREKLAIIAISSENDSSISSHLLKLGANDFIHKPFIKEEFDCRINNTIRALENFDRIRQLANNDYLTGLLNRRAFFTAMDSYQRESQAMDSFSLAMFDLDDFKKINDTYGHEAGDLVLKTFSEIIKKHMRSADIAARFGGEEFCVVLTDIDDVTADKIFETIRADIEKYSLALPSNKKLNFTTSIGISHESDMDVTERINLADERLYKAKLWGKNCIYSNEKQGS